MNNIYVRSAYVDALLTGVCVSSDDKDEQAIYIAELNGFVTENLVGRVAARMLFVLGIFSKEICN